MAGIVYAINLQYSHNHEIHETCLNVTCYFMKKTHFMILPGRAFYQIVLEWFTAVTYMLKSENEFFYEIKM